MDPSFAAKYANADRLVVRKDDRVYLCGGLANKADSNPSGAARRVGVIPEGFRPSYPVAGIVGLTSDGVDCVGSLEVSKAGVVTVSAPAHAAQGHWSFFWDGTSWPSAA